MRRRYVPMGPFPDYEKIPEIKSAVLPVVAKPVSPPAPLKSQTASPKPTAWPFDSRAAAALQKAAAGNSPTKTVQLGGGVTLELVRVPGGSFVMGSNGGHPDETPASTVEVKPFWMARFETSNQQFRRFDPAHESRTEDRHGYQFGAVGYDQDHPGQPAVRVSWEKAMAFCRWLSQETKMRVTLPTEAQWEWACRAGSDAAFSFGPSMPTIRSSPISATSACAISRQTLRSITTPRSAR